MLRKVRRFWGNLDNVEESETILRKLRRFWIKDDVKESETILGKLRRFWKNWSDFEEIETILNKFRRCWRKWNDFGEIEKIVKKLKRLWGKWDYFFSMLPWPVSVVKWARRGRRGWSGGCRKGTISQEHDQLKGMDLRLSPDRVSSTNTRVSYLSMCYTDKKAPTDHETIIMLFPKKNEMWFSVNQIANSKYEYNCTICTWSCGKKRF